MAIHENSLKNLNNRWNEDHLDIPLAAYTARSLPEAIRTYLTTKIEWKGEEATLASVLANRLLKGCLLGKRTNLEVLAKIILMMEDKESPSFDKVINVTFGNALERNPNEVQVRTHHDDGREIPDLEMK